MNVVSDIVKRYDIDAIHMDDYFYPYRIAGKEFPDDASYRRSGSKLIKNDWRRSNVDSIIRKISTVDQKNKTLLQVWYFTLQCLEEQKRGSGRQRYSSRA